MISYWVYFVSSLKSIKKSVISPGSWSVQGTAFLSLRCLLVIIHVFITLIKMLCVDLMTSPWTTLTPTDANSWVTVHLALPASKICRQQAGIPCQTSPAESVWTQNSQTCEHPKLVRWRTNARNGGVADSFDNVSTFCWAEISPDLVLTARRCSCPTLVKSYPNLFNSQTTQLPFPPGRFSHCIHCKCPASHPKMELCRWNHSESAMLTSGLAS